jgi:hypothetical protein
MKAEPVDVVLHGKTIQEAVGGVGIGIRRGLPSQSDQLLKHFLFIAGTCAGTLTSGHHYP